VSRRSRHRSAILNEDHLNVGSRTGGARISYWTGDGPDLARVRPVGDHDLPDLVDMVKDEVIRKLAEAWDVVDDHGTVFSLRRYEGADHPSYDVVVDGDRVVGTFFHEGGLVHEHVIVRDDASAPVAEIDTRDHVRHVHRLRGADLAACRRTYDPSGNDELGEIWSVDIEGDTGPLDRRVLVAAPLVCHLIGRPKRHFDPDSTIAASLLVAVPPVGGVMIVAERVMDGLYWLRRKFD
jgi:hypothetical protein